MPTVSCDYTMSEDADPKIEVRTIPGGKTSAFPALQIGPVCIYPSRDQLHSIMCTIDDYLEVNGYYTEAAFEADDRIGITEDPDDGPKPCPNYPNHCVCPSCVGYDDGIRARIAAKRDVQLDVAELLAEADSGESGVLIQADGMARFVPVPAEAVTG